MWTGLRVGGWQRRLWLLRLSDGNLGVERQLSGGGLERLRSSDGGVVVVVVVVGGVWRRATGGLRLGDGGTLMDLGVGQGGDFSVRQRLMLSV